MKMKSVLFMHGQSDWSNGQSWSEAAGLFWPDTTARTLTPTPPKSLLTTECSPQHLWLLGTIISGLPLQNTMEANTYSSLLPSRAGPVALSAGRFVEVASDGVLCPKSLLIGELEGCISEDWKTSKLLQDENLWGLWEVK